MINRIMAFGKSDFPLSKEEEPYSEDKEKARPLPFGIDEFGLLDLVLMEGVFDCDPPRR